MDIKQLKTFICVAETGSLSRASDRLRLAPPALSRQIRLLESELGVELFSRHARGMEPTDAGLEFHARIDGLVSQLQKSVEDIQGLGASPRGVVALGLVPTVSPMLAQRIVARATSDFPEISLRIVEGLTGHMIDWLQRGDLDIAILPDAGGDLHLRTIGMLFEQCVLLGHAQSDLSAAKPVHVADLAMHPLILSGRHHSLRNTIESAAQKAGVELQTYVESDMLALTLNLVEAGAGFTILPYSTVVHYVEAGRFRCAPLIRPAVARHLALALPTGRADTRATLAVKQVILDEAHTMIGASEIPGTIDPELVRALAKTRLIPSA